MKRLFFISCLTVAVFASSAAAARAVTLNGMTIDGQFYSAMLYGGAQGITEGRVLFMGDRARMYLSNGQFINLRVADDLGDPNFISATGLDGQTYRLQLRGSLPGLVPEQNFGPLRPHQGAP